MMTRFAPLAVCLLVTTSLALAPCPAAAQPKEDKDYKPKIQVEEKKEEKKEEPKQVTGKKPRPTLSAEDLYRMTPSASEEKLQAAIEALYGVIDNSEEDDPEKPVYYARLATLYWEKAETYFMQAYSEEIDNEIRAAGDDPKKLEEVENKRNLLLESQKEWRRKAVKIFQELVDKYPDYDKLDMVLFYLGNFSAQMGESEKAYEYYTKLLTKFPESKYVPDALVNVGEYFFQKDEFDTALEFYKRVEKFTQSTIYPFAIYKEAWCHYNLGEYEEAFKRFVDVIQYTIRQEAEGKEAKIGLKSEAQKDIVLAYSQIGKEANAIPFFKSIAPDIYLVLAARLAELYSDQGEPEKAIRMYKWIIEEVPDSPTVLTYQRHIVINTDRLGDKLRTKGEVERMVKLYEALHKENSTVVEQEKDKIEEMLRRMAIGYHAEAQKTMEKKAMLLAQEVYDHYLRLFPDGPGRYEMTMNHAILLYQLEQFDKAVVEYENVVRMQPEGKYAREAGYTALLCYYKLMGQQKVTKVKTEEEEELKPMELPPLQAGMVAACDRFVKGGSDDKEEILQAKFAAAKILYDYNHFEEAAPRLAEILEMFPDNEVAPDAAKLLLSCYAMLRDIKNLNAWADRLYLMPHLAKGELLVLIQKIRDQAKFNRCFQYEFDKQYEAAADCFVDYTEKFPDSKLIDKSLYNAALDYQRAKKYEKALKTNERLYNCCAKGSPLGARALFLIAETYRAAAVYDLAAQYYELYAKSHPKEQKVQDALMYAAKLRRGLGQYPEAIADYQRYMELFKKDPKVPAVFFDIGTLYKRQKKWKEAIKQFQAYINKFGKEGGLDLLLAAHQEIGEAYVALKQDKEARRQFDEVISTFQKIPEAERSKIGRRGISAIAWAYFNIGEGMFREAAAIKLERKTLKEDTQKKMKVLVEAEKQFLTVLSLRQPYWNTAALFKIGDAWEKFAYEFENSPLPTGLTDMEKEEYKLGLTENAEQFRKKAIAAYKKCLEEAKAGHVFNEYTDRAEERLSTLEFQFAGMKEYRVRPGYYTPGSVPSPFKVKKETTSFQADTGTETKPPQPPPPAPPAPPAAPEGTPTPPAGGTPAAAAPTEGGK